MEQVKLAKVALGGHRRHKAVRCGTYTCADARTTPLVTNSGDERRVRVDHQVVLESILDLEMVWLLLTSSVVLYHRHRAIAGLSIWRILLHVTRQHMMESHLRVRVPSLIELARYRVLRELHLER